MYFLNITKDVLKKLCSDGLPKKNCFELCASYMIEFEHKMKQNSTKDKSLKEMIENEKIESKNQQRNKNNKIDTESILPRQAVIFFIM